MKTHVDKRLVVLRSHATVDRGSTTRLHVGGELTTPVPGVPELNGHMVVSRGCCGVGSSMSCSAFPWKSDTATEQCRAVRMHCACC
jgi:hypothetical protein